MTGLEYTRRTKAKIATGLRTLGTDVSDRTVAKLLKKMQFSLRVNHKQLARICKVPAHERDAQFMHIVRWWTACQLDAARRLN